MSTLVSCESCTEPEAFRCSECLVSLCQDHAWTDGKRVYCANDFEAFGVLQDNGPGSTEGQAAVDLQEELWRQYRSQSGSKVWH